jgi:MFS family permease
MGVRNRSRGGDERSLKGPEKRLLALLGLPTFGLALSIGTVTTYVPLLARQFTSSTAVIGLVIAAEGLVALFVPIAAGAWSDQLRTRFGGRIPFLAVGAPVIGVTVASLGFMKSLAPLALIVFVFFLAYYAAYEPYRALYPDLLTADVAGRGQSTQAVFRGVATGTALVGGGLLFALSPKLPFLIFALLAFGTIAGFVWRIRGAKAVRRQDEHEARSAGETVSRIVELVRARPALRAFLFANALWELSLAALKTFIMLFLTVGMGLGMSSAAGLIGIVLVLILISAPISGTLGDRFGKTRVVGIALWLYGIGLLVPFFTQSAYIVLPIMPLVAFGGGMILTLPYAILMPLMPDEEHGLITGFYSFSRGIGILLGPALAGLAIMALRSTLPGTAGYAAMWLVCAVAILASVAFMRPLRAKEDELRRERSREDNADEDDGPRPRVGQTAGQTA